MKKTGRKTYRIFSIITVIAIMLLIFLLSAQNAEQSTETSSFVVGLLARIFKNNPPHDLIRTAAHFSEYALLAFLISNALHAYKVRLFPLFAPIISWGYAWTDEVHQIFVPGRAFQLFDLAVDLGGIILGTLVFTVIIAILKKCIKGM